MSLKTSTGIPQTQARRVLISMWFRILTGCLVLCLLIPDLNAQGQLSGFSVPPDTIEEDVPDYVTTQKVRLFAGRPGKAALYSIILPGAGQAYNRKYWQVPIVWAGVGTAGWIMAYNINEYRGFSDAYDAHLIAEMEGTVPVVEEKYRRFTKDQLLNYRNQVNRYRQISIVAFAATWVANSAQAYVSAHLKDFDIDDDLSLQIIPGAMPGALAGAFPVSATILVTF